jgi:hypothetical protein
MNTFRAFSTIIAICLFSIVTAQRVNDDYYRFGAKPAQIPMKLNGFNSQGGSLFFGISDPGLDSTTAVAQALKRAQAMVCLSKGVKIKNYTTGYNTEAYRGNTGTYQSMVELVINSKKIPTVTVLDTVFTVYDEAIVFIQAGAETMETGYQFAFNRFNIEYQWGGYNEYSEQIEIFINDNVTPSETLVSMKYGTLEDVYTMVEDESFPLPMTRYQYLSPGDSIPQVYRYGLWINIMRELNIKLGHYSKLFSEQIRKMNEVYQLADKIDEGLSKNTVSFDILNLYFKENQVTVDLNVRLLEY